MLPTGFKIASLAFVIIGVSINVTQATSFAAPPQGQDAEQAWVTGRVNVRSGPGPNYKVVNRLKRGDFVNVGKCRKGWCYVDVHGGNGYVPERVIGEGENPYNSLGPAEPGYIPHQEPGTLVPID